MSQDLEDAPFCSGCGHPMAETTSANPQLHHGGVPFACQSNPDCPEYAPDGVGTVKAVNLLDIAENHTPRATFTLECQECHLKTIFPLEDLTDQTLLICSHCGVDHGTGSAVKQQLGPLLENLAAGIAIEQFDNVPGFTANKLT